MSLLHLIYVLPNPHFDGFDKRIDDTTKTSMNNDGLLNCCHFFRIKYKNSEKRVNPRKFFEMCPEWVKPHLT